MASISLVTRYIKVADGKKRDLLCAAELVLSPQFTIALLLILG
jgi:hypothetical protein